MTLRSTRPQGLRDGHLEDQRLVRPQALLRDAVSRLDDRGLRRLGRRLQASSLLHQAAQVLRVDAGVIALVDDLDDVAGPISDSVTCSPPVPQPRAIGNSREPKGTW